MKVLKIVIAVICGLSLLGFVTCVGCAGLIGAGIEESAKQDSIKKEKMASGEISGWEYSTEEDEMGRGETKFAKLPSADGKFTLIIRNSPKFGKDVIISNEDEWFDTELMGNSYLKAKFDDGAIKTFAFNGPEGSVANQAFIKNYKEFMKELKAAKKLIVEARFVNEGDLTATFYVSGLEWEE